MLSINQFLWHSFPFSAYYRTGGSSSELVRLKEDLAPKARVVHRGGRGPEACSPGKFWNLASLKHTDGAISERINEKISQNLPWKCTCKRFETPIVKRLATASLLKLRFYCLYKQNNSCNYLLFLLSLADEILIISKSSVAIFLFSRRCRLIIVYTFDFKKFTILFSTKRKCD